MATIDARGRPTFQFELRRGPNWFLRIIFALAVLVGIRAVCAARAHPQDVALQDTTRIYVLNIPGWPHFGSTICYGNTPFIIIQAGMPDSQRQSTLRHELVHINRLKKDGCIRWTLKYATSLDFRLREESEAYCAELRWWDENTERTYEAMSLGVIAFLADTYKLRPEKVSPIFRKLCPPPVEPKKGGEK